MAAPRSKTDPPGDAEKPEGTPAARDGSPDEDELARRRAEKAGGTSVADRVRNGDEDGQGEMFPHGSLAGDPRVTYKNLVKSGARVTVTASLTSAEVPITGGGLFDPEQEGVAVVRYLPAQVALVPQHKDKNGQSKVEEWTLRQTLRTLKVEPAGELVNRIQVVDVLDAEGVSSAVAGKVLARLFGDEPEAAQA